MLQDIIYKFYEKKNEEYKKEYSKRDKLYLSPSGLTACKRALFYKYTDTEPSDPITIHANLKMDMGTTIHERIQNILKMQGIYESGEEYKQGQIDNLNFNYRVDGRLKFSQFNALFELKTVYASGYNTIEKEPKEAHIFQVLAYMKMENYDKAILLYLGRDNGHMVEYLIELEKDEKGENLLIGKVLRNDILKNFYGKLHELQIFQFQLQKRVLPPRDYKIVMKKYKDKILEKFTKDKIKYKTDWQCSYCQYKNLCWGKEIEEFKKSEDDFFIPNKEE